MGRTTTIVLARTEFVYGTSDNRDQAELRELSKEEAFDRAVFFEQVEEESKTTNDDTFHTMWPDHTAHLGWQIVGAFRQKENRQRNMKMQAETLHFMFTQFLKSCKVPDKEISNRLRALGNYKSRAFGNFPETYKDFDIEIQELVKNINKKPVVDEVWEIFYDRMRPFLELRAQKVSQANVFFDSVLFATKLDEYFDLFKEDAKDQPSQKRKRRRQSRLPATSVDRIPMFPDSRVRP